MIYKNRNRGKYTFANINLLGTCNADCYFCLGKDIPEHLAGKNQLAIPFLSWPNFDLFLDKCRENQITKLYLTGQTADGLQYKYLENLVDYLQNLGFLVGVRTNGYLAEKKMSVIKKMREEIGYSIHSLNPDTNEKIMGKRSIPDWEKIIPASGDNVRVAIVVNRYNVSEFFDIVKFISRFPNVRYIQVRRISTDTRYDLLAQDIKVYENFYNRIKKDFPQSGEFHLSQRHDIFGKPCYFWRTVETSANSLNYFTDGVVSDEYFIVEGYLKNLRKKHQC